MTTVSRILVVDDEPLLADTLAAIFERAGYNSVALYSAEDALDLLSKDEKALIVTDVMMPGMDGIQLAKLIRTSYPNCQVIIFSGNADPQALLESAQREGYSFEVLAKPVPPPTMLAKVASLLEKTDPPLQP